MAGHWFSFIDKILHFLLRDLRELRESRQDPYGQQTR